VGHKVHRPRKLEKKHKVVLRDVSISATYIVSPKESPAYMLCLQDAGVQAKPKQNHNRGVANDFTHLPFLATENVFVRPRFDYGRHDYAYGLDNT
jgi:hypothetical protein